VGLSGKIIAAAHWVAALLRADREPSENPHGVVAVTSNGSRVGNEVLASGGNAVDAIVARADGRSHRLPRAASVDMAACDDCAAGKKITALDLTQPRPPPAPDMFPLDAKGAVIGRVNDHGWLAPAWPGTLAGLQLALTKYGTRSFRRWWLRQSACAARGSP